MIGQRVKVTHGQIAELYNFDEGVVVDVKGNHVLLRTDEGHEFWFIKEELGEVIT